MMQMWQNRIQVASYKVSFPECCWRRDSISSRLQIPQLGQRSDMYLGFCPHLVPHRFESHADDCVKALELSIPDV